MYVEYGMSINNKEMLSGTTNAEKAIIEWTSAMFANLMGILVAKGILTSKEALKVSDDTTKFLDEEEKREREREREGEQKK